VPNEFKVLSMRRTNQDFMRPRYAVIFISFLDILIDLFTKLYDIPILAKSPFIFKARKTSAIITYKFILIFIDFWL
jgi:hypothetical protein